MIPNDNSDHSWLVYADWLDDNGIPGANDLRDQIYAAKNPPAGIYEYRGVGLGVGVGGVGLGGVGVSVGGLGVGVGGGGGLGGV